LSSFLHEREKGRSGEKVRAVFFYSISYRIVVSLAARRKEGGGGGKRGFLAGGGKGKLSQPHSMHSPQGRFSNLFLRGWCIPRSERRDWGGKRKEGKKGREKERNNTERKKGRGRRVRSPGLFLCSSLQSRRSESGGKKKKKCGKRGGGKDTWWLACYSSTISSSSTSTKEEERGERREKEERKGMTIR